MRNNIWDWIIARLSEGQRLPWWALATRAILFPLDFFYWQFSRAVGYQWESDTWLIEGIRYSGRMLRLLSKSQGELYLVTRIGEIVTIERVNNAGE